MNIESTQLSDLQLDPANVRKHDGANIDAIKASLTKFGQQKPIVVNEDGIVIAGNGTLRAAQALGWTHIDTVTTPLQGSDATAYAIADNRTAELAQWDDPALAETLAALQNEEGFDHLAAGFTDAEIEALIGGAVGLGDDGGNNGTLAERFGAVPVSVLNSREGWWQDRKRGWVGLGIKSEVGRGGELHTGSTIDSRAGEKYEGGRSAWQNEGTSIFDPVLCELMYAWFCPDGGTVLDPFAGGSVRGIVASKMGRKYTGQELRAEQVNANKVQAEELCSDNAPTWHTGDSADILKTCGDIQADFVFSCPPYADLEVYSDDPADLSNMPYKDFIAAYRDIIAKTCSLLKPNRFACFVVGDVRDKKGNYRNFVGDTVEAFRSAGLEYYNEGVLVTAMGSLPIRVGRQFNAGRKLGKTHQNFLVFVKGDSKKATQACGDVYVPQIDEGDDG
jgi:hypothetical protein